MPLCCFVSVWDQTGVVLVFVSQILRDLIKWRRTGQRSTENEGLFMLAFAWYAIDASDQGSGFFHALDIAEKERDQL